jgi:3-oxoacyl-[acyl-carrier-protein] synthase-1
VNPLYLTASTLVSCLGQGTDQHWQALRDARGGLRACRFHDVDIATFTGTVDAIDKIALPKALAKFDCRNHRLAHLALGDDAFVSEVAEAAARYGSHRIGLFLGTSTSGIEATEQAYGLRDEQGTLPATYDFTHTHNNHALVAFTAQQLQLTGPALVISTACSSSAKVFATASRYIELGICDAAVVGGVDSLCRTTLYGFNALELVSAQPCQPWGSARDGINIGEAAGFALLERSGKSPEAVALLGYGESSDGYHMSTPHPGGLGAQQSMQQALQRAGLASSDIDYINLHGTGTPSNDRAEDRAIHALFGDRVTISGTKGWTGHCLGAAGIVEALIACGSVAHGYIPGTLNTEQSDPELKLAADLHGHAADVRYALSNSFGFGGNNCSLIFGRGKQ